MSDSISGLWIALILAIVEGLTEFIPVSSTGHLILFGNWLEFEGSKAHTFEVFIQLGAILSVVVLYWPKFLALFDLRASHNSARGGLVGFSGMLRLFVACLPVLIVGAGVHDFLDTHLFKPVPVALALIIGGVIMLLVEKRFYVPRLGDMNSITYRQCFLLGLFQCVSLWPGISRSGSTIIGGMLVGFDRKLAAEFSFFASVPVMFAAVSYKMMKSISILSVSDIPFFATGFVVSFLVAIPSMKFLIGVVSRFSLTPFAIYRILLGILVLGIMAL